jgi:hypothetical protein
MRRRLRFHPVLAAGLCCAFLAAWMWRTATTPLPPSAGMELMEGIVISAECQPYTRPENGEPHSYYTPVISYSYRAGGQQFAGHRYNWDPNHQKMDQTRCQQTAQELNASNPRSLWYLPADPSRAILVTSEAEAPRAIEIFAGFAVLMLALGVWLQVRLQQRLRQQAQV